MGNKQSQSDDNNLNNIPTSRKNTDLSPKKSYLEDDKVIKRKCSSAKKDDKIFSSDKPFETYDSNNVFLI